jgi:hypothetical protein
MSTMVTMRQKDHRVVVSIVVIVLAKAPSRAD